MPFRKNLIEEQNQREQQDKMITALASDYRSVYHIDLDLNDGVCYRADPEDKEQTAEGVPFPYYESFKWYAEHSVDENYRDGFLEFIDPDNIRKALSENIIIDGRSALKMLEVQYTKHEPYNLVLLDWKMPEMDGIECAEEIRKLFRKETTIIILTSFNWDEIMDKAMHIGVDSFLAKPLFASDVISEFERIARKNNMLMLRERKRADLNGKHILLVCWNERSSCETV